MDATEAERPAEPTPGQEERPGADDYLRDGNQLPWRGKKDPLSCLLLVIIGLIVLIVPLCMLVGAMVLMFRVLS